MRAAHPRDRTMSSADATSHAPDPLHARPNYLATISLVLGIASLLGQACGACMFWCAPFALALPTGLALFTGWYGLRQARETGVGATAAILGLTCAWSSVAIGSVWLVMTGFYALMMVLIALL